MRNVFYLILALVMVTGCAKQGSIADLSQDTAAPMASYTVKTTPTTADAILIIDAADANRTKRAFLGDATYLGAQNGEIGDVMVWVDGGSCSDPAYTTEATCVAAAAIWTPVAAAPIDVASGVITDSGNLITATTIEGALAENRTAIDLNTAKVTNTDDQTATEVPVTATGFTGNLSGTDTNVQTALATIDAMSVSGSSSYVATPPTYSDEACTAGQYAFNTTTGYVCVASGDWNTFALTNWSAPGGDNTPNDFSFTNQTDVAVSTTITSANVQITGITANTAVSATGGTAAICTGALLTDCGTFGASPGNVTNNQYVAARHTSSASASTAVDTVVTVGTMERTFRSTTAAGGLTYTPGANEVVCIVDTDTTNAAADYHSLEEAVAGEIGVSRVCATGTDLVTNTEQLTFLLQASDGTADTQTNAVTLGTFTTNADYFVRIITHPAHRHNGEWDATKYRFVASASLTNNFYTTINHVVIDGLQITKTSDFSNRSVLYFEPAANTGTQIVRNNIIVGNIAATGSKAIMFPTSNGRGIVYNNIITGYNHTGSGDGISSSGSGGSHYIYSNTLVANGRGISASSGTVYAQNNIAVDSVTEDYNGTFNAASSNNISSDLTAPGNDSVTSATSAALFTDAGTGDYTLASGSAAVNAGATLGSPYNVDIIGTSRPQSTSYDIGAFERQ